MRLDIKRVRDLTDRERAALKQLSDAVYPPHIRAASAGRHITWAALERCVLVSDPDGELVSYIGFGVRAGTLDGGPVTIGGIGSVKTHPRAERRGYASAGLR